MNDSGMETPATKSETLPTIQEDLDKDDLSERLRVAWSKYVHFFAVPPHGTYKQLRAMLEFMPPKTK